MNKLDGKSHYQIAKGCKIILDDFNEQGEVIGTYTLEVLDELCCYVENSSVEVNVIKYEEK
ncbi:hypothetical protein D3C85_1118310 [compost metagenome]